MVVSFLFYKLKLFPMKRSALFFLLVMIPFIIIAQETGKDAVVAAVRMNVMYRGLPNPVEIAVPGVSSDRVSATATNGTINKTAVGWEVIPAGEGELAISVLVNNKKIAEKMFRVKNVPAPVAVFAGKYNGVTSKDNALKNALLEVKLIDFDWDIRFVVKSFSLFFSDEAGDKIEYSNDNKLTDKMRSIINQCKRGQYIIFKDIKAVGPDGKVMDLNPIVLKIE